METINIESPIENKIIERLRSGDRVLLSGIVYTARDAAHARLVQALDSGDQLPFTLNGQTIYYLGPSPAPPGHVIGAAGPTTSSRMDIYTPRLLAAGLKAMIGKGQRSAVVKEAIQRHKAVYLAALGGSGALLSRAIKQVEIIAYPELGPEAVQRLEVVDFPAIVANDIYGGDIYELGPAQYKKE
jgi:fumarate hydratase subunit beta